jgi:nucleoside-diphosphate-sugar epimerase
MTETLNETILIAGCGRIGTRLGQKLAGRGARVLGLRRRDTPLPAPLETVQADMTRSETLAGKLPARLDRVYFIATPGAFEDEAYRLAYVVGLTNLLATLRHEGHSPRRVILVSSTAVYGQLQGEWVDETSPTEPNAFSGQRMREAERTLLEDDVPGVAVRFGGIYGADRTRMLDRVRQGKPCVAEPPHYTNRIHEDDAVGILEHVGDLSRAHPVYLGVDSAPCTQCELMDWLANRLDLPRPERTEGSAGGTRGSNKCCRNNRLLDSGYRLLYSTYREGYEAMLAAGY